MTKKAEKAGRKVEKMQEQMKELVATKRSYDEMVDSLKTEISNITHGHDVALMEAVSAIMDSQLQYHGQCYALLSNIQANFKVLMVLLSRYYCRHYQISPREPTILTDSMKRKRHLLQPHKITMMIIHMISMLMLHHRHHRAPEEVCIMYCMP